MPKYEQFSTTLRRVTKFYLFIEISNTIEAAQLLFTLWFPLNYVPTISLEISE